MKSLAGVDEEFGLGKWPKHRPELRTANESIGAAGVGWGEKGIDRGLVEIAAPTDIRSQPVGPVQGVLREHSDASLLYGIAANGRQELPLHTVVQVEPDIVISGLHANFGLHRQACKLTFERMRPVDTAENAVVVLVKLIAVDGITEKIGEIVPEVERTLDDVEIGLGGTALVGVRPAPRQREAIGISAIAGIERAIKADLAGSDSARWNLIGGIPLVRIGHPGQREAVLGRALAVAHHAVEFAQAVGILPRAVVGVGFARDQQRAVTEFRGCDA